MNIGNAEASPHPTAKFQRENPPRNIPGIPGRERRRGKKNPGNSGCIQEIPNSRKKKKLGMTHSSALGSAHGIGSAIPDIPTPASGTPSSSSGIPGKTETREKKKVGKSSEKFPNIPGKKFPLGMWSWVPERGGIPGGNLGIWGFSRRIPAGIPGIPRGWFLSQVFIGIRCRILEFLGGKRQKSRISQGNSGRNSDAFPKEIPVFHGNLVPGYPKEFPAPGPVGSIPNFSKYSWNSRNSLKKKSLGKRRSPSWRIQGNPGIQDWNIPDSEFPTLEWIRSRENSREKLPKVGKFPGFRGNRDVINPQPSGAAGIP